MGTVTWVCNPSTEEADTGGGFLGLTGQFTLPSERRYNEARFYERDCLNKQTNQKYQPKKTTLEVDLWPP